MIPSIEAVPPTTTRHASAAMWSTQK